MRYIHWVWLDHWGRAFARFRIATSDARMALERMRTRGPRARSWRVLACTEARDAVEHLDLAIRALIAENPYIVGE